jgi:polysaccharide biosynthesis/export protein
VKRHMRTARLSAAVAVCCVLVGLAGCASFLPAGGANARDVTSAAAEPESPFRVIEISSAIVGQLIAIQRPARLSDAFGKEVASALTIGAGDALEISVWEAPPAALFSPASPDTRSLATASIRVPVLPEQTVSAQGTINMPFVGSVAAAGRTPQEVEQEISRRLKGKANDPQVLVRVLKNASSMVTVVGDVRNSARFALTATGERLLDAIAASGGVSQPVGKISIRITRQQMDDGRRVTRVATLPLDSIIMDPAQNILLKPGDVVTALHQSNSFTVLGATSKNEEVNFEAQGISLAQALARSGGLQDQRANPTAVFLFRFEDPAILSDGPPRFARADGRVPVIYQIDLKNPASFFLAQDFPMRNRDVLYVANAPAAELQKFMNLLSSLVFPFNYFNNLN